jgi:hypothetical protein
MQGLILCHPTVTVSQCTCQKRNPASQNSNVHSLAAILLLKGHKFSVEIFVFAAG